MFRVSAPARALVFACAAASFSFLSNNSAQAQGPDRPWTGFYAGLHAGYAWGDADVRDTNGGVLPGPFSYDPRGAFGGGTIGYNWRIQGIVVGVEADLGYMDLNGEGRIPSSTPPNFQRITLDGGFYADATLRLGVLLTPSTLVYGKGGFAYFNGEARQKTTKPGYETTGTDAFNGFVIGGGVEHFITSSLSIRAEYLHFDFGSEGGYQTSITDPPIGFKYLNKTDVTADAIKFGVAWHF
jgi:outer membrane immunogenic protein